MLWGMKSWSSRSSSGADFGDAVCAGDGSWKPSCLTSGGYAIGLAKTKKRKAQQVLDQISFGVSVRLWESRHTARYLFTVVYFPHILFSFRARPRTNRIRQLSSRGSSHSLWHSLVNALQNPNHIPTHTQSTPRKRSTWHPTTGNTHSVPRADRTNAVISFASLLTSLHANVLMCTGETMFLFRVSRFVRSCTTFVHRELRPDCGSKVRFVIPHTLGLCTDECPKCHTT